MYSIIFKFIDKKAPQSIDYGAFLCYVKRNAKARQNLLTSFSGLK